MGFPHMWTGSGFTIIDTRWMHDIVGRAWPSAGAEHGSVKCLQLSSEPQATEYHNIHRRIYTHTHQLCVRPNIYKACCRWRWHGQMTALWLSFFTCTTGSLHRIVVRSIVPMSEEIRVQWLHRNRESDNKNKQHRKIAMRLPLSL